MSPVKGYAILAGQVKGLAIATPPQPPPPLPGRPGASNPPAAVPTPAIAPSVKTIGFGFPKATIDAFDSSGKSVGHVDLPSEVSFGAFGCGVSLPAQPAVQSNSQR